MENGEKPKMKIVHIKDNPSFKNEHPDKNTESINFSHPVEITPEFIQKIELSTPERETTKRMILNQFLKETNQEIKKHLWQSLLELIEDDKI